MVYFDMDGTIADLYNVDNWLEYLRSEKTLPYRKARELPTMQLVRNLLNAGEELGVISWGSKGASAKYNKQVASAKRYWLKKRGVNKNVHIVKYGTPKHKVVNPIGNILIDDNKEIIEQWENNGGIGILV